jgi:hypothetical protein
MAEHRTDPYRLIIDPRSPAQTGTSGLHPPLRTFVLHAKTRASGTARPIAGATLSTLARPHWQELGWSVSSDNKEFRGEYRAAGRRWRGRIRIPYPGAYTAYIWHPPLTEIRRHTGYGYCFFSQPESGCYEVHFHTTPRSLTHAITTVERVLSLAYPLTR